MKRTIFFVSILLVMTVSAFGGGSGETQGSGRGKDSSENFLTITHKYGETILERVPQRVVSVGYSEHDTILALGVVPVAVRDWYGDMPFATWPWAQDKLGGAEPFVLSASELDFEAIATLAPDVILGITSGMTEEEYDTLSKIAPVIAQPGDYVNYGTPWQEETLIIGKVLGKSQLAQDLVASVEDLLTGIRADYPEFGGATIAVAYVYNNQPGAYASQDTRSRLMRDIGFVIPPEYDEIAGDSFYMTFSEERLELLDTDVILWFAGSDAALQNILNLSLRDTLDANAEGRELFMGKVLGGAFSFSSVLSIKYCMDALIPALEAAIDGDPSTVAPDLM